MTKYFAEFFVFAIISFDFKIDFKYLEGRCYLKQKIK